MGAVTAADHDAVRDCVVCGSQYTRNRTESVRRWATRPTCSAECAVTFRHAPLGEYPTPLLTCRICDNMARPNKFSDGICNACNSEGPLALLAYARSAEGRAFIAQCRQPRLVAVS